MERLGQQCTFQEVHNIRDLALVLEHMGLEGSSLGKQPLPVPFNIQTQQEATHCILEQLLTITNCRGSPNRQTGNLIALESGLGGGKTHTAAALKDNFREAITDALRMACSHPRVGYDAHEELHAAFHDDGTTGGTHPGRVACIRLEFDGDDGPCGRDTVDANLSVFLGLRLFSRGLLGVSTKRLWSVLPPELECLLTIEEVWPAICERLRRLHGLDPFTLEDASDPTQWLVLLLTLDEVQCIQTGLESMGWARHRAAWFCRDVAREVAPLVYVKTGSCCPVGYSSPVSPSAECGVILQPVLLGTCLRAFSNHLPTQLVWKQVLPAKAERVSFFERLFGTVEMQGALEMGGGVPGILAAGVQALAGAPVLPRVEYLIKNNEWKESNVSDLATAWTSTWGQSLQERCKYSRLIDSLGVVAAKQLLLLVLSGIPVWHEQPLSGSTLSDALASGAFYTSKNGRAFYSVTLPAILLQLFYDTLSTRLGPTVFCAAEREVIMQLIKPQVSTPRESHREPFEVMVAAQQIITAACWRALGAEEVTLASLFGAAHKGIQGGFLWLNCAYKQVELHDTMRLLTRRSDGRKWGEKGTSVLHGASQLNPWLNVKRPPCAASAGLLDPGYAVLVDTWSDCAMQPVAGVGIRVAYNTRPPSPPILMLLNLTLREGAYTKSGGLNIVRSIFQSFFSEEAEIPFEPLIGLVTPGKIDEAAFQAAVASDKSLLIISDEACVNFMPVLRHRPILRRFCAAASKFDAKHLQKVMAAVDGVWGP